MPTNYFQTTQDLSDLNPFILKHSKVPNAVLVDNLFRKKLYETPKKNISKLLRYHYEKCDEPTEFADHVIELLEVALDENEHIKFMKSLSFWGDKEKAKRYKRRTEYALEYLRKMNDPDLNEANAIRFPFNGDKVVLADLFRQLIELKLPDGQRAVPLNKKDMARCLIGISENFKNNKLETVYEYFKNNRSKVSKGNRPKKYRIKVLIEEV